MATDTPFLHWLQGTVNRCKTSTFRRRNKGQIEEVQQLEARSLLTVAFQFNYAGAIGSGAAIGFEDATNGQVRRDALELAGQRLGAQFSETATIVMGVTSSENANSTTLASAGSENIGTPTAGFNGNEVVRTKILTGEDLNDAAVDGTVDVNWGSSWETSANSADVSDTEYDFLATIYHELLHATGWSSSISVDGKDMNDVAPAGQAGAWSYFDQFITDVNGTPIIHGGTLALDATSWNTNKIGGPSPSAGLFFSGTNAKAANGGLPVGLYTPVSWEEGSSVTHLDDENPLLQPLMMAAARDVGPGARNITTLERSVLKDLGYTLNSGTISVTQSGGSTTVSESGSTDSFTVVLTTQPMVNVVLNVSSANTLEVTVNKATLTFTPENWNIVQTVTVTGVSDLVADGTQFTAVTVSVNAATSDDGYDAAANKAVSVSTTDVVPLQRPVLNSVGFSPGVRPTLSWQAVTDATRYEVWFSRVFPSTARVYLDSNVTTRSWTPPADLGSGLYRYWVRAFDAGNLPSPWSNANSFQVRPTVVSPLAGSFANPATFQWNTIPFAASYELFLRTPTGDQMIPNISTTSYTPAAALPTGAIQWWIRATGFPGGANSGWSLAGNANTTPQAVVTGPVSSATTTPNFTWTAVPGSGRYVLYVALANRQGAPLIYLENLHTTSYTPPTPLASGEYRAWVKAIDATTNSLATAFWSRPFSFTVTSVGDSQLPTEDNAATLVSIPKQLSPILAGRPLNQTQPNPGHDVSTESADTAMTTSDTVPHFADVPFIPILPVEILTSRDHTVDALELQILDAVMEQSMLLTAMLD